MTFAQWCDFKKVQLNPFQWKWVHIISEGPNTVFNMPRTPGKATLAKLYNQYSTEISSETSESCQVIELTSKH